LKQAETRTSQNREKCMLLSKCNKSTNQTRWFILFFCSRVYRKP